MCKDLEEIDCLVKNISYSDIRFGNRNSQLINYAKIPLIFYKWRITLPQYYRPLIDFYREKMDEILPNILSQL